MSDENFLVISDIHNYAVCKRRFALRAIENMYEETWRTVDGDNMHRRAHDSAIVEKRGDVIIFRGLRVASNVLRVSGECDVVEFRACDNGISLSGYDKKYTPYPIEYKRGVEPIHSDCDRLQLCAQAMCLEEMLLCDINCGSLFYGESHRRVDVEFVPELRSKVIQAASEMHILFEKGHTPKSKINEFCDECSLNGKCMPKNKKISVKEYIEKYLNEEK